MKKVFDFVAVSVTLLALLTASVAACPCWFFFYTPKVPKSLLK